MGLGKGRKIPQSVKTQRKIDHAVATAVQQSNQQVQGYKQQLLDQAKKHQKRVDELKQQIDGQAQQIKPMLGVSVVAEHRGILVRNWQTFWKWLSTWAFAAIAYVSIYGVPSELMQFIPEASQSKVTALLALIGFIGRFLNQSKPKAFPPVDDDK